MKRYLPAMIPLVLLLVVPFVLKPRVAKESEAGTARLVILTPHPEPIKYEFEQAFIKHYKEKTGQVVTFDWRAPGGTSDIVRYINDKFIAGFREYWTRDLGREWTTEVASSFSNYRVNMDSPETSQVAKDARKAFLESNVGIGADIFFGGGQYNMAKEARMGHAVDAGMQVKHPDWFTDAVIPRTFSGETFYDKNGAYYGACLSAFGICYNSDRLKELSDPRPPTRWRDLGETRFFQKIAIADPTKSGSITKCFEMLIQQEMYNAWKHGGKKSLDAGWANGLNLIKRIGGNSCYISSGAGRVPRDVAAGNATAGICIDFYGRTEAEWTTQQSGQKGRIVYVTPVGGSSISADPIQLLRGAPNREVAVAFIEFVLSKEGQRLWNYRVGTDGGPVKYALRRLPVRRDMYTAEDRANMSDPNVNPFVQEEEFEYHGEWTGRYFGLIRVLIKCMVIAPVVELRDAWAAIVEAGGPDAVPQATAAFNALPFGFGGCPEAAKKLSPSQSEGDLTSLRNQREWSEFFRKQYKEATRLAREGK